MKNSNSYAGHSLPINTLLSIFQIVGLILLSIGLFSSSNTLAITFLITGGITLALAVFFTFVFRGALLSAAVGRVFVGVVFIVSGLIKANDPIGFTYKLAEYFEDGALAYRFKEWFGMPDFSFEFLIPYALSIAIFISILEIVLGVLAILGGKMKLTACLLMLSIVFFSFLTWHTFSCKLTHKYTDENTISLNSKKANFILKSSKLNQNFKVVSKESPNLVYQEQKQVSCVTDCGCFGDALRGTLGRSLLPIESFWKDLILLFFISWIFLKQRRIEPNTIKENWIIIPTSLVLLSVFSFLISWFFPLLFGAVTLIVSTWFYRSFSRNQNGHFISVFFIALSAGIFIWFNLKYEPMKDFRPYAVGKNLHSQMRNGKSGIYNQVWIYENAKTGKEQQFTNAQYMQQKIWENDKTWKFIRVENDEVKPMIFAAIDSLLFNPTCKLTNLPLDFQNKSSIKNQLTITQIQKLRIRNRTTKTISEIDLKDFSISAYPKVNFELLDTRTVKQNSTNMISALPLIFESKKLIVINVKDAASFNNSRMDRLKEIVLLSKKLNAQVLLISGASSRFNAGLIKQLGNKVLVFQNDLSELRNITRTYPSILLLEKGTIIGKYGTNSIPTAAYVEGKFYKSKL